MDFETIKLIEKSTLLGLLYIFFKVLVDKYL